MAKFNTGNPLGSTDPRDLLDNATIADHYVDDTDSESWPDRFGRERRTWHGMEMDSSRQLSSQEDRFQQFLLSSGYVILPDYIDGPITFTARNQITAYNGEYYRPKASVSLPFTTTGKDSTSWDNDRGNFVSVGDAALRQELSDKDGYQLVGGLFSQEGDITTSPDAGLNIDARRGARGQFDVVSQPWEPQAVAGMTFGGTNGRGTLLVDHRGMVSVSVWYKGKRIQKDVLLPVLQSLGYKSGPDGFQGSILRMGRPDVSPSIIVDYDSNGLPILVASNPHQFGESGPLNPADEGYSYNVYWSRKQTQSAISASIGSYNPYFTYPLPSNDQAANVWVPIATFTTATGTGNPNGIFKALLQVSGNVFANNRTYLISGNSRGLSSVSLTSTNVNSYFNIAALDAPLSNDANNVNYIVSAGVVQSGNTVTLYLKMPYYTGYSTIQALVVGFPSYVKYNPSSFSSIPSAPAGMVYLTTIKPYTSANVTVKSDGTLVAASPIVRVATEVNKSDRDDITANGFQWSGSGCVNVQSLDYKVVRNSVGDYSIPTAKLALEGWQAQPPRSIFGGDDLAVIEVTEDDSGVNVKVFERKLTLSGNDISVVKGELMDVPMNSWIDIRLFDKQQIIVETDTNE